MKSEPWTENEKMMLAELVQKGVKRRDIAKEMGRSFDSVSRQVSRLGLSKKRKKKVLPPTVKSRPWTVQEIEYIKSHWLRKSNEEIGTELNRSKNAVTTKAVALGLSENLQLTCQHCGKKISAITKHKKYCDIFCQRADRMQRDIVYRFSMSFRNRVKALITAKRPMLKTASLLGWGYQDFHAAMMNEKYYEEWMLDSRKYHTDHIIPLSYYQIDQETHPDLPKAWSLRNLRIVSAEENLQKNDKLDWRLIAERGIMDLLPESLLNNIPEEYL